MNLEELTALLERARQGPLGEEDCQRLEGAIQALSHLIERIGEKNTTISQLRALLAKPARRRPARCWSKRGSRPLPKNSPPRERAGPAEAGARPKRRPGVWRGSPDQDRARFPEAGRRLSGVPEGKVYEQKEPALRIRVVGQAPIAATVYELERLRCNLCGEIFEAEAPASVGEKKYDETAAAMIALLKYGSGVPFYRLEGLEASLGIPLPASTQWEIVEEIAAVIRPAFDELLRQAAQGEVFYNDDTSMKILALARASPPRAEEEAKSRAPRSGRDCSPPASCRRRGRGSGSSCSSPDGSTPGRTSPACWSSGPRDSRRPFRCGMPCRATCRSCRRSWKSSWETATRMLGAALCR